MAAVPASFVGSTTPTTFDFATSQIPTTFGGELPVTTFSFGFLQHEVSSTGTLGGGGGPGAVTHFRMRAKDANSPSLTYRRWTVQTQPDLTGAQYSGPFDGPSKNFVDVVVEDTWVV